VHEHEQRAPQARRLDEVVDGAGVEALDSVIDLAAGSEDDDR
jgi:hypothetical protein